MCRIAAALLLLATLPPTADAQELTASIWTYAPFGLDDLDGDLPNSAELRLSVPISTRFAIEPFVTVGQHGNRRRSGLEGFYGVQVRQRIVALTGTDTYAFATYGAALYYSEYGSSEIPIGHFGFGMHQQLTDRVALRAEAQVMTFHVVPVGTRFAGGVSVRLGRPPNAGSCYP